jgi:hypothetical protein
MFEHWVILTLGCLLKITKEAKTFWAVYSTVKVRHYVILTKRLLATFWAICYKLICSHCLIQIPTFKYL